MSTISRLPHIPAAEIARILGGPDAGRWTLEVQVRRPGEPTWTNLSAVAGGDWVVGISTQQETPDQPVGRFTIRFMARADGRTVAPGASSEPLNNTGTFAPVLYAGNHVRVRAGNAAGTGTPTMRKWLVGRVEDVEWPEDDVIIHALTPDGELYRTAIEEEEERGADEESGGTPIKEEIQGLINRWAPWVGPLRVLPDAGFPGYAELGIGEYVTTDGAEVGPFVREWAQRSGADLRYLWNEEADDYTYTLFLPPRDDTTPRLTLGPDVIRAVSQLRNSREHVRNRFKIKYTDRPSGLQSELRDWDSASEAQFGAAYMLLHEGTDSPIDNATAANHLLAYAKHDLAQPPTDHVIRIPFFPWLSLHDVLAIDPDDARFDYQTIWSVVGIRHEISSDSQEEWYTEVFLRGGSPVGMYYDWHKRPPPPPDDLEGEYGLINFRPGAPSAPGKLRWVWTRRGNQVASVWFAYRTYPAPWADDNFEDVKQHVEPIPDDQNWVEIDEPRASEVGALWVEPRMANLRVYRDEVIEKVKVVPEPPRVNPFLRGVTTGGTVDLSLSITATPSSFPVTAVVYADSEDEGVGTVLATHTFMILGSRSINKQDYAALGGQALPSSGTRTFIVVATDVTGEEYRDKVEVSAANGPFFDRIQSKLDSSLLSVNFYGRVNDPAGLGGTLRYWVPTDAETDPDPAGPPTGSHIIPSSAMPFSFGPDGIPAFGGLPLNPGRAGVIYLEFIASDDRTTGVREFALSDSLEMLVDLFGKLRAGSVYNGLVLSEQMRPYYMGANTYSELAAIRPEDMGPGNETDRAFIVHSRMPYLWDEETEEWVEDHDTPPIAFAPILRAGVVSAEVIAAGAIRAKLVGSERLIADNLDIGALSLIASDVGAIISGSLVNTEADAGLDLDATGNDPVLWAPGLEIRANGSAVFSGSLASSTVGAALSITTNRYLGHAIELHRLPSGAFPAVAFVSDNPTDPSWGVVRGGQSNLSLHHPNNIVLSTDAGDVIISDLSVGSLELGGVSVMAGANDSGGAGYRALVIPNI